MNTKKPNTIILLLLIALASVAAVLYTPALPEIITFFHVSAAYAQLTMTFFLIAYAVGPTIYGPLQHRFGRKPTLYAGMLFGMFGMMLAIISAYTHTYSLLIVGRFIEGLGTSVGLVVALTMINDSYEGTEARKILSITTLAFALLPGIAIFAGGLLLKYTTWVGCFYLTLGYTFAILLLSIPLPETSPQKELDALNFKKIITRYYDTIKDFTLIRYAAMWGLATAIVYLFASFSPLIIINQLGISPEKFGLVNIISFLGLILGNLISAFFAKKISARKTIFLGILCSATGSIVLTLGVWLNLTSVILIYATMFFCFAGLPMIFTNASALATAHISPREKATASAVIAVINMGTTVIALFILSNIKANPAYSMSISFVVLLALELILFLSFTRKKKILEKTVQVKS